jgi:hypothetical protein
MGGTETSWQKRKDSARSLPGSSRIQDFPLPKEGEFDERDRMPGDLEVDFGLLWILSIPDLGVGCCFPQPLPSAGFLTLEPVGIDQKPDRSDMFKTSFEEKRSSRRTLLRRFP